MAVGRPGDAVSYAGGVPSPLFLLLVIISQLRITAATTASKTNMKLLFIH